MSPRRSARFLVPALLAVSLELVLALAVLESPLGVVAPISGLVVGLGALVVVGAAVHARARPGARIAAATVAALAGVPIAWVMWQEHGRISCTEVTSDRSGVTLAGTLCAPRFAHDRPGVVLVHGSGPATRDELVFYARFLARRGVAALAYDKRGTGASGGALQEVGYRGYAEDARAMLDVLTAHPAVERGRAGYLGFSEAEWVIPLALRDTPQAFAVIVGASGLSPEQQVRESIGIRVRRAGFSEGDARRAQAIHDQLHDYLRETSDGSALEGELARARTAPWFEAVRGNLPAQLWPRSDYAWWIAVMDASPAASWAGFRGDLLFVKGRRDDRSAAEQLEPRVRAVLPFEASASFVIYEDADHALLEWPLGERVPPPRWPAGYPQLLADWLGAR